MFKPPELVRSRSVSYRSQPRPVGWKPVSRIRLNRPRALRVAPFARIDAARDIRRASGRESTAGADSSRRQPVPEVPTRHARSPIRLPVRAGSTRPRNGQEPLLPGAPLQRHGLEAPADARRHAGQSRPREDGASSAPSTAPSIPPPTTAPIPTHVCGMRTTSATTP